MITLEQYSDRNSCILFGDGAGAMVLTSSDDSTDSGILSYATHSDGEGHSKLLASYKGEENAVNAGSGKFLRLVTLLIIFKCKSLLLT